MLPPDRVTTGSSGRAWMSAADELVGVGDTAAFVDPPPRRNSSSRSRTRLVGHRQLADEAGVAVLGDPPHAGGHGSGAGGRHVGVADGDRPAGRAPHPGEDLHQFGLAVARDPGHAHDLARGDVQRDIGQRRPAPGCRWRRSRMRRIGSWAARPASAGRSTPKLGRPTIIRQLPLVGLAVHRPHHRAATQHRDPVADGPHLGQLVADERGPCPRRRAGRGWRTGPGPRRGRGPRWARPG